MPVRREFAMVMIRFVVEERHLTDMDGRPVTASGHRRLSHLRSREHRRRREPATSSDGAAELIGNVLKFPGFQAVATIRKASGVYTLQFTPASQGFTL